MVLTRSNRDIHTFLSTHTMREKQRAKWQDKALTPSLECFLPLSTTSSSSSFAFLTTTPFNSFSHKEDEEPFPFPPAPRLVRQDAYLGLEDTDDEDDEDDEDEMEDKKDELFVHTNKFGMDDATAGATAAVLAAVRNLTCNTWNDALLVSPLSSPSWSSMSASTSSSSPSLLHPTPLSPLLLLLLPN